MYKPKDISGIPTGIYKKMYTTAFEGAKVIPLFHMMGQAGAPEKAATEIEIVKKEEAEGNDTSGEEG